MEWSPYECNESETDRDWENFIEYYVTEHRCMISDTGRSINTLDIARSLLRLFLVAHAEVTLARQVIMRNIRKALTFQNDC